MSLYAAASPMLRLCCRGISPQLVTWLSPLQVLRLGISLNPGFAERVTIYGNVVYDAPGNYSLRVPLPGGKHKKKLGMTGMEGRHGILKSDFNAQALRVSAASVRPLTASYSPLQPLAAPCSPVQPLTTPYNP